MQNTLLTLITLLYYLNASAQDTLYHEWFRSYSYQDSIINSATAVDANGYAYVTGFAFAFATSNDVVTAKYDQQGNLMWVKTYNGPGNHVDVGKGIIIGENGNIYVLAAISISTGYRDYALLKYSPDGTLLWVVTYDNGLNDNPNDIAIDHNGKICVTGESENTSQDFDYATIKYDTNGTMLWIQRYNNINLSDVARAIAIDGNHNILVTGGSIGVNNKSDFATVKYDNNGNLIWIARTDGIANEADVAVDIAIDNFDNVYVCGASIGTGTYSDFMTVKYNSIGTEEWNKRYTGNATINKDQAVSIAVNTNNEIIITGVSSQLATSADFTTIKYDITGQVLWLLQYDGGSGLGDAPSKLILDNENNIYITGSSGNDANRDIKTIKYSDAGSLLWFANFNGTGNGDDQAHDIAVNSAYDVFVVAQSFNGTNYDFTTIKYKQPTPLIISIDTKDATCNGFTDGAIDLTVTGGVLPYTYQWSNGATTQDIDSLSADTFLVTVSDNAGSSILDTIEITEPSPDNSSAINIFNNPYSCTDLFFSEYIEGSGKNRALGIYNASNECRNLFNYKIKIYQNALPSNPSVIPLTGVLTPNKVFTCGHDQADPVIKGKCKYLCSCIDFDGNDAVALYKNDTLIDIIGEIGSNPGVGGWQVGTGFTKDNTLRRGLNVRSGSPYWNVTQLEYKVLPINTSDSLALHRGICSSAIISFLNETTTGQEGSFVSIYLWSTNTDVEHFAKVHVMSESDCVVEPKDPPASCIGADPDWAFFIINANDLQCWEKEVVFPASQGTQAISFTVTILPDNTIDDNESVCFWITSTDKNATTGEKFRHSLVIKDIPPVGIKEQINYQDNNCLYSGSITELLYCAKSKEYEKIIIYDLFGRILIESSIDDPINQLFMNNNNSKGMFFVKFISNNKFQTIKFIKQ